MVPNSLAARRGTTVELGLAAIPPDASRTPHVSGTAVELPILQSRRAVAVAGVAGG